MTVMELLNECITELGSVRPSVDEFETVAIPIYQVKNKLMAMKKYFEEQEKKESEEENEEI